MSLILGIISQHTDVLYHIVANLSIPLNNLLRMRGDAIFVTFLSRKKSNQKKALANRVNGFRTKVHSVIISKIQN